MKKIFCHDCQKAIKKGKELVYQQNGKKITIFKCESCFLKNKSLTNFQPCEVYSRVVGYLRPVQQWNKGKQEEFNQRKTYDKS